MIDIIKKLVASWKTTLWLLLVYAAVIGVATFVESAEGTEAARQMVYHASWFFIIHVLLIINFIAISIKQKLLTRRLWGVILLHSGFLIIIIGAFVTHGFGYEGFMHIREGESSQTIIMDGRTERQIPIHVTLNDFQLERYHGSNSPSSFKSDVTIVYKNESKDFSIYMNNIARIGGFRLYQTSYDPDERGTVLTVNSDTWGSGITYVGYFTLVLGLILAVFSKKSRLRTLARDLAKGGAVAFVLLNSISVSAQNLTPEIGHAKRFGELMVQTPDGRIEPVNTYSSEILRKLYHDNSYKGLTSDQVLIGIITTPEKWAEEPIIYIKRGKYVTFNSLFSPVDGSYKLDSEIERIALKSPKERTKSDKEFLKLDEKVNILYALFNGEYFSIFPTEQQARWYSTGDDLTQVHGKDSLLISKVMTWYGDEIRSGNTKVADEVLDIIKKYQNAKSGHFNIDEKRIRAEIQYNRANFFSVAFRGFLIMGFLTLVLTLLFSRRKFFQVAYYAAVAVILGLVLYQTVGIGLRWYISGRAPWTNAYESMIYVGWVTVVAGLCFVRRSSLVTGLATLLGGVVLFVANLNWLDPQITPLVPVLKSYWLMIHVSVITASYGLFGISAMCGIGSLLGIITGRDRRELRIINEMAMIVGLVLLTAGIFFGAIWANESWGRYWGWDPKETWALATMIVYAAIIHSRFIQTLNNVFMFSVFSVVGILFVLMTYFGVSFYLSGLHAYAGTGELPLIPIIGVIGFLIVIIALAAFRYYGINKK